MLVLIMAGGVGERFWPASRRLRPKQLLDLTGRGSMLRVTLERVGDLARANEIFILTNAEQRGAILAEVDGTVRAEGRGIEVHLHDRRVAEQVAEGQRERVQARAERDDEVDLVEQRPDGVARPAAHDAGVEPVALEQALAQQGGAEQRSRPLGDRKEKMPARCVNRPSQGWLVRMDTDEIAPGPPRLWARPIRAFFTCRSAALPRSCVESKR